jgi:hypothetical protein
MVGEAGSEDLRLGFQPPECARVDDAVAVALKGVSVWMFGLGILTTTALLDWKLQPRQHGRGLTSTRR